MFAELRAQTEEAPDARRALNDPPVVQLDPVRSKGINTPALILSALGQIDDRVKRAAGGRR